MTHRPAVTRRHPAWPVLLGFVLFAALVAPAGAEDCLGPGHAEISALLEAKKWDEAKSLALQRLAADPASLEAELDLARVHLARVVQPGVQVDFAKAGIPVDAQGQAVAGSHELDIEKLQAAVSDRVVLDPAQARAAQAALEAVLSRFPAHLPAHLCLMDLLRMMPDHEALLAAVRRAGKAFPSDSAVDDLLAPGLAYAKEERLDRAADVYAALLESHPGSGTLLSDLGAMRARQGLPREALPLFERAVAASPKDPMIAANLGRLTRLLGDLDASERWFTRWHELEPQLAQPLFDLAILAMRKGPQASTAAWDRYLALDEAHPDTPSWSQAGRSIRASLGTADVGSIRDLAQQLIAIEGGGSLALPLLAWLEEKSPGAAWPAYLRAQVLEREGQHALAAEQLVAVEALVAKDAASPILLADVWWNLARNLSASGAHAAALAWLSKVEAKEPTRPDLQYFLGNTHAGLGHADQARTYWQRCTVEPNNADMAEQCRRNLATSAPPPQ